MRRHDALIPLTHDHHHALAQVRKLRMSVERTEAERAVVVNEFLHFFQVDTIQHFREEEESLFPLVADAEPMRETLEQVMIEHLQIHAFVARLTAEFESGNPTTGTVLGLCDALERHIRFEEKTVFPLIEANVDEAALQRISLRPRVRERAVS